MEEALFFIAAIGALAGAIGVVFLDNPFYSVLALVGHLVALSVLFLLLSAEFVAAAQIVVYAGAVMVLYVFVVAYIGQQDRWLPAPGGGSRLLAGLFAGALLAELWIAFLGTGLKAIDSEGANVGRGFGSPEQIGNLLLERFLLAFELASVLLLVAAVGAVVLARRRGGPHLEEEGRVSVMDALRPPGTGTMAESVGGRTGTPEHRPTLPPADSHPEHRTPAGGGW